MTTYLVTGASGQLGQRVIDALAARVAKSDIIALVRSEKAAEDYAAKGIATRFGDYTDKAKLEAAFAGVDRLLLISSSEIGQRAAQHGNVIAAAKAAGVSFIAYTSILNAQDSAMALAEEHKATEDMLAASGIAHTLLRNGWYSENITMTLDQDLELGQHFGAAGAGKLATATRQDYADAAAVVLAGGHDGEVLELAGDEGYTLADYAALVSELSGKAVTYTDMPEAAFTEALVGAGLPAGFAAILADSDAKAAEGALFDDSKTLSKLIGRPTEPIAETIKAAL
ncbi:MULTISPECIES: SDR family oxidoreductase [Roseobacteraceae]|jgi:NAD(P)H dehydrogenase (quinone)|uniref:SDR family oxidoreductase n=1 Tax=Roseobacteraceae TaxID=2854170 RepID=UPI00125F33BC|nr:MULTISPECIES: SDR family oxidoreductase [Roseobacteraceae]KAB6717807.1 NAD(P)-dependent oxidoreductase [Roseobacter sp. TSBP12]|tara:strand:- start:9050 stop:9901 length:852 start_codon:yes stop_codon:yes gene_type:complete